MSNTDEVLFFGLEPLIVEHIKTSVPELISVNTPMSVEDFLNNTNIAPSVGVIWHDLRVSETAGGHSHASTYHQWMIILNVRNASAQSKNTNGLRETADPLIRKILAAMKGFQPHGSRHKFKWVNCPIRAGGESGQGFFPFLFEIQKLE